jgi:glycosyltransferase involved in cell wall biosynthesis
MTDTAQLTIVMPAFNEAAGIERVLDEILAEVDRSVPDAVAAIVVVDDGSSDGTGEAVQRVTARDARVRLVPHERNRGFGAAVKTAIAATETRYALMVPSDGEWEPAELPAFRAAAQDGVRIAIGERDVRASDYSAVRRMASSLFSLVVRVLFGVALRDLTWVQMYDRERVDWQTPGSETATYPVQIVLLDVSRNGGDPAAVRTQPSTMRSRNHGESKVWRPRAALRMGTDLLSFWWRFRIRRGRTR